MTAHYQESRDLLLCFKRELGFQVLGNFKMAVFTNRARRKISNIGWARAPVPPCSYVPASVTTVVKFRCMADQVQ